MAGIGSIAAVGWPHRQQDNAVDTFECNINQEVITLSWSHRITSACFSAGVHIYNEAPPDLCYSSSGSLCSFCSESDLDTLLFPNFGVGTEAQVLQIDHTGSQ